MKTTINMFQSKKDELVKKSKKSVFAPVLVIVLLAAAIAAIYLLTVFQGKTLKAQVDAALQYVDDPANVAQSQEALSIQQTLGQYTVYEDSVEAFSASLADRTQFDSSVYDSIVSVKPDRVTLTALSLTGRTLTIECIAAGNQPPADFAQALDGLAFFSGVEYQGFRGTQEEGYTFLLSCILSEGGEAQ